uniref:Uncharacterized mitochondrial protein AtMg00860-like n=1 Tax=Nicotiana tabacum TaxID=4097 RepID=A0A1S4BUA7_TOBAC
MRSNKCSFAQKQIDFLGHVIEEGRIKMDQQKIQAITEWPPPKDIHALRSFLGLCNFYRRFVKSYSLIAVPLTELLKKATPWDWGPKRAKAFDALKMAMSSSPVLALPDLAKPFEVRRADLASMCVLAALKGSEVTTTVKDQIQDLLIKDPAAQYLVDLVGQGKTRQVYTEDGFLK